VGQTEPTPTSAPKDERPAQKISRFREGQVFNAELEAKFCFSIKGSSFLEGSCVRNGSSSGLV
jgi:hypothetical protein